MHVDILDFMLLLVESWDPRGRYSKRRKSILKTAGVKSNMRSGTLKAASDRDFQARKAYDQAAAGRIPWPRRCSRYVSHVDCASLNDATSLVLKSRRASSVRSPLWIKNIPTVISPACRRIAFDASVRSSSHSKQTRIGNVLIRFELLDLLVAKRKPSINSFHRCPFKVDCQLC